MILYECYHESILKVTKNTILIFFLLFHPVITYLRLTIETLEQDFESVQR